MVGIEAIGEDATACMFLPHLKLRGVLPEGCRATVDASSWAEPPLFDVLRDAGQVSEEEMRQVFNLGIGMIVIGAAADAEWVRAAASDAGIACWTIGSIERGGREVVFT